MTCQIIRKRGVGGSCFRCCVLRLKFHLAARKMGPRRIIDTGYTKQACINYRKSRSKESSLDTFGYLSPRIIARKEGKSEERTHGESAPDMLYTWILT